MSLGVGETGELVDTGGAGEARQVRAARAKPAGQPATLRLTTAHFALYRPTWKASRNARCTPTTACLGRTCA